MKTAIHIAGVDKKSISQLGEEIQKILAAPFVDQTTKQVALRVLARGVNPGPNTISGCHFDGSTYHRGDDEHGST